MPSKSSSCPAPGGPRTWLSHMARYSPKGISCFVRELVERLLDLGLVETISGPGTTYRATDTFVAAWLHRIGVIIG